MLDHEQDVEPVQQQRVDAKESPWRECRVLGRAGILASSTLRGECRVDADSLEDQPHRAGRKPVAEPGKFTVNPAVSPG
jgi:hypothetical protein